MPNICTYSMKATGPAQGLRRLYNALTTDYHVGEPNEPEHLWRVFECSVIGHETIVPSVYYSVYLYGDCAWSISACMLEDGYMKDSPNSNGTTLTRIAKEEGLVIEVYSWEPGCAFSEHYLIYKGDIIIDSCVDYYEITESWDIELLHKYTGIHWTQEQFDNYFKYNECFAVCAHKEEFEDHIKYYKGEINND